MERRRQPRPPDAIGRADGDALASSVLDGARAEHAGEDARGPGNKAMHLLHNPWVERTDSARAPVLHSGQFWVPGSRNAPAAIRICTRNAALSTTSGLAGGGPAGAKCRI